MKTILGVIAGVLIGYVCSEFLTAGLSYFGIDVGPSIIRTFDKSYDVTQSPRDLTDDVYLMSHRSPVPVPNEDITRDLDKAPAGSCMSFMGLTGEQGIRNLYVLKYGSIGLNPPDVSSANCVYRLLGERTRDGQKQEVWVLFVRPTDGPTCERGLCATDVWIYEDAALVLSMRANRVGIALTSTAQLRDIVADDYYLFTWNGTKYAPRYF